jgi:D-alanine-D-alanine ligase
VVLKPRIGPKVSSTEIRRREKKRIEITSMKGYRRMNIGMTYDLRSEYLAAGYSDLETAEFDSEETVAAIENALGRLGHRTDRIGNIRQLAGRLAAGDEWDLVFNISEGLQGAGREAQVPALLEAYGIPYTFSDPLVMSLSLHKGMTKHVIRDCGLPTAPFKVAVTGREAGSIGFEPPLFIKPVAEGTGKGVTPASIVRDWKDLVSLCDAMISEYCQPVLIEKFLPGRELTVGILGTGEEAEVLGSIEVLLKEGAESEVYSFVNKEHWEERVEYRRPDPDRDPVCREAEAVALDAWRALGCRDAGRVDLRCDNSGRPNFMEVNPLAGLRPEYSDLPIICSKVGMAYETLIERIVLSAMKRNGISKTGSRTRRE